MNKIGIITFHFASNYGAVLQTFALTCILEKLGNRVWIIDRRPDAVRWKEFLINVIFTLFPWILKKIRPSIYAQYREKAETRKKQRETKAVFDRFRQKYLERTTFAFYSSIALRKANLDFDACITGSDQVWNCSMFVPGIRGNYFLDFAGEGVKRISYAASFGHETWGYDDDITKEVKGYLEKFDAISVRESSGCNICRNIFNVEAEHVLDPTFLPDRKLYLDLIDSVPPVVPSVVGFRFEQNQDFIDCIDYCCKALDRPAAVINSNREHDDSWRNPSVETWLRLIHDSELVVTDSFHCMAFSVIMHKNFIVFPCESRGLGRIMSFLKMLGLESRYYSSLEQLKNDDSWRTSIDFDKVDAVLRQERDKSINFIKQSLMSL